MRHQYETKPTSSDKNTKTTRKHITILEINAGKLPDVMSAHPKVDPISGELLSVEYNLHTGALLYLRAEEDGFIFTFVHVAGSATGSFIILDARNLA